MQEWKDRPPLLGPLLAGANYVDVKTAHSSVSLREFVAAMLAYEPWWLRWLFKLRGQFVRLIGLRQPSLPPAPRWTAAEVPTEPGQRAWYFTVRLAAEDRVWAAEVRERHLAAQLCVVREDTRFLVVTIVHYRHWTGRLYFNLIRPFHHWVVTGMARSGARGLLVAPADGFC